MASVWQAIAGSLWRLSRSSQTAVVIVIAIAVATLLGILIQQAPPRVADVPELQTEWFLLVQDRFGPLAQPLTWLGLFSVFSSWWFKLLIGALAFNTLVCTVDRLPGIWRSIKVKTVPASEGFFSGAPLRLEVRATSRGLETLQSLLAASRFRVLERQEGNTVYLYADRNRWLQLSTLVTHTGVLILLVGVILGAYGFNDSNVAIMEGANWAVGHGTGLELRNERFVVEYYENGLPKDMYSEVVLLRGGVEAARQAVRVNTPLAYEGINFHLLFFGYGSLPDLEVRDAGGTVLHSGLVPLEPAGEHGGEIGWVSLPGRNESIALTLVPSAQSVSLRQLAFQVLEGSALGPSGVLEPGQQAPAGDIQILYRGERGFAQFRIVKDPGWPLVLAASILIVAGACATFYFPRRRLWCKVTPESVTVVGETEKLLHPNPEFHRIGSELEAITKAKVSNG